MKKATNEILVAFNYIYFKYSSFFIYQSIVFIIPSSNLVFGYQPNSFVIFVGSMAYLKSCPFLSATKDINSSDFPKCFKINLTISKFLF